MHTLKYILLYQTNRFAYIIRDEAELLIESLKFFSNFYVADGCRNPCFYTCRPRKSTIQYTIYQRFKFIKSHF